VTSLSEEAFDSPEIIDEKKRVALEWLTEAWADAEAEGIEADIIAHAALFAALTDLVERYGEKAVGDMAGRLSARIMAGEYTLRRPLQ
jgi:hypothetical protein